MSGPLLPVRIAARPAAAASSTLTSEQQAQIAAQHAAFDFQAAESAELLREHEALQALMLEQLKNEDKVISAPYERPLREIDLTSLKDLILAFPGKPSNYIV